jgi:hypothetical protein
MRTKAELLGHKNQRKNYNKECPEREIPDGSMAEHG